MAQEVMCAAVAKSKASRRSGSFTMRRESPALLWCYEPISIVQMDATRIDCFVPCFWDAVKVTNVSRSVNEEQVPTVSPLRREM